MSDLNQVVSNILEQLTQARHESDQYSAELSKVYYEDEFLQYFTVPKMDIRQVEIKMKIGLKNSTLKENLKIETYQQFSEVLAEAVISSMREYDIEGILTPDNSSLITDFHYSLVSASPELLDTQFHLDFNRSLESLSEVMLNHCFDRGVDFEENEELAIIKDGLELLIKGELITLQITFLDLSQIESNLESKIEIDTEILKELPESAITEMKLITNMQNYQWAKAESGDSSSDQLINQTQA